MKFGVIAAALLVAASATTVMAAQEGPYVGVNMGITIMHDSDITISGYSAGDISYNPGFAVGAALGYELASGVRFEGELGYRKCETDTLTVVGYGSESVDGDLSVTSYMFNTYADLAKGSNVSPFVGVGIGILDAELSDNVDEVSDTALGYQLMAGVTFKVTPTMDFDMSYRYQGAAKDFEVNDSKLSYGSSNIMAAARFKF